MKNDNHTTQDKPASLNNKLSFIWWLTNSVGITLVPCMTIFIVTLPSISVLFVLIGVLAGLIQFGLWFKLRQQVHKPWRWTLIGFLTWGLVLATAAVIYFLMEDFMNAAAQVPTGFVAVLFYWLIALITGYVVTGLVLIMGNLYVDKLLRL